MDSRVDRKAAKAEAGGISCFVCYLRYTWMR